MSFIHHYVTTRHSATCGGTSNGISGYGHGSSSQGTFGGTGSSGNTGLSGSGSFTHSYASGTESISVSSTLNICPHGPSGPVISFGGTHSSTNNSSSTISIGTNF